MHAFTYHNPTRILFGEGQIAQLAKHIPAEARILWLYGGGSIHQNGVYEQVAAALQGRFYVECGGVEANPQYQTLMQAVRLVQQQGLTYVLAVGGGSVLDGAKFIAAAALFTGEPWDILEKHAPVHQALPLGCVLTLPATGSESNAFAVISRAETQQKFGFGSPCVQPQFAVLDPTTSYSLPPKQIANGVVDAFVHVMEQYLTYPVNAPLQDRFAEGLLLTLIEQGPKALSQPQDYATRATVMWAATLALNGLIGLGVPQDWATHVIGHEITALHGLDHAQTLAIILPALLQVQRETKREKLLQYGRRVWQLTHSDENALITAAITATAQFFESLGVPTHLSAYGIPATAVAPLLQQLAKHHAQPLGERQDITAERLQQILHLAV